MWPYFFILLVPSFLAIFYRQRVNGIAYGALFALFVLFVGLRDRVGPDWGGYEILHWRAAGLPLADIFGDPEPLSNLLFRVSEQSGAHMLVSNVVAAIVLIGGVTAFARRTANPWLAIVSATPYLIIAFGMSGIRQAIGAGIFLFVLSKCDSLGFIGRSIGVAVAALFHTSALICELFVLAGWRAPVVVRLAAAVPLLAAGILIAASVSPFGDALESYRARYLEGAGIVSPGSVFHIALIVLPAAVAGLCWRSISRYAHDLQLLRLGVGAAPVVLALNFLSTTAASRLTLYVYFLPMMVYPAASYLFGARYRALTTLMIVALHLAVLFAWLRFGNNSVAHVPYRNLLFER